MKFTAKLACVFIGLCRVFVCRRHKSGRGGGADVPANPHGDPASPGHEALPAVPHRDAPASAQHEPLSQLQHGESWCKHTRRITAVRI